MIQKSKKNGYMLIESLLAILITTIITLLAMIYLQTALKLVNIKDDSQLYFALLQVRQELSLAESIHVKDNQIVYILNHEERILKEDKNRLVKTPGFEIFMEGIQDVYFYEEDNKIYIHWKEENFQLY